MPESAHPAPFRALDERFAMAFLWRDRQPVYAKQALLKILDKAAKAQRSLRCQEADRPLDDLTRTQEIVFLLCQSGTCLITGSGLITPTPHLLGPYGKRQYDSLPVRLRLFIEEQCVSMAQ